MFQSPAIDASARIRQAVEAKFSCPHDDPRLAFTMSSNGVKMYRRQCPRCGEAIGNFLKHASLTDAERAEALAFDDDLRGGWLDAAREFRSSLWDEHHAGNPEAIDAVPTLAGGDWRDRYEAAINSAYWREIRARVLVRDQHTCQACLAMPAAEVHHLTYAHLGREFANELISVCADCHAAMHGREAVA